MSLFPRPRWLAVFCSCLTCGVNFKWWKDQCLLINRGRYLPKVRQLPELLSRIAWSVRRPLGLAGGLAAAGLAAGLAAAAGKKHQS